jgi:enamine deaminase RidA (YjgF/YER057c/UK114 family)
VPPCLLGLQHHTVIGYDGLTRVALMVTPEAVGDFRDQAWEAVSTIRAILRQQNEPMALTVQTVFVDDAANVPVAKQIFEASYGKRLPLTLFVVQPPCDGRALAIEAWAISTRTAQVDYRGPHLVTVTHDGLRWIHASAGALRQAGLPAYEQAAASFEGLRTVLAEAGATFEDVVRVWLYQGGITEREGDTERYRELNRARSDFFAGIAFDALPLAARSGRAIYPASTGIGTLNHGLITTCLALQTERSDVRLLPLENPLQMPAFDYPDRYSIKSPKFSRAIALRIGDHVTTWISGTASIVDSETAHAGDVAMQTEQTLTNIERLIDADNFERRGWIGAGATLGDLAKVRVYVKHAADCEICRAVCERRLGRIPAIYAQADVCRPDLLVEIEGVAFSPLRKPEPVVERSEPSCA